MQPTCRDPNELQWGRGDEAADTIGCRLTSTAWDCFNGAAAMKPRIPRQSPRHRPPTRSFNGAAAMKPRIQITSSQYNRIHELQWGRGDEAADTSRYPLASATRMRLQWGRGDEAADTLDTSEGYLSADKLQWGRGDEAADTSAGTATGSTPATGFNGAAAMKPRIL